MNVLVTGGTGYVGTSLVQELRSQGFRVFSLSTSSGPHIDDFVCDLTDILEIESIGTQLAGQNIKVIVHLASKLMDTSLSNTEIFDRNLQITLGFTKLAKLLMPAKLIHASSTSVYPEVNGKFDENSMVKPSINTDAPYGLSKFVAENLIDVNFKSDNIQCIHLRIGHIYGEKMPANGVIPTLRKELKLDSKMTLFGSGKRIIPFVNISFLIDSIISFIEHDAENGVFNVVSKNSSIIDIAHLIAEEEGIPNPKIVLVSEGKTSEFCVTAKKLNDFLERIN